MIDLKILQEWFSTIRNHLVKRKKGFYLQELEISRTVATLIISDSATEKEPPRDLTRIGSADQSNKVGFIDFLMCILYTILEQSSSCVHQDMFYGQFRNVNEDIFE